MKLLGSTGVKSYRSLGFWVLGSGIQMKRRAGLSGSAVAVWGLRWRAPGWGLELSEGVLTHRTGGPWLASQEAVGLSTWPGHAHSMVAGHKDEHEERGRGK